MKKKILYYKPRAMIDAANAEHPGTLELSYFFKLYNAGSIPVDRTGTIVTPVDTLSMFPMPPMRSMTKTYEELCNERASELLRRADSLDAKIHLLWSGGIDSTLVLVSLLKNATPEQKKRIVVLLSKDSIDENPDFYKNFIRGQLETETSSAVPDILGSPHMLLSGEHNDQIFGSDMTATLIAKFGADVIHKRFDRSVLLAHVEQAIGNKAVSELYLGMFDRLWRVAPFPLVSFFDHLWWVNFSLKWQTVYTRMLTYVSPKNAPKIDAAYVSTYYAPFYNTPDFQQWSLNNHDKKIKDTWASYKWVCKDIIYDFTKDAVYRDTKLKIGSLAGFVRHQSSYCFVDESFGMHAELDMDSYYLAKNDFILPR